MNRSKKRLAFLLAVFLLLFLGLTLYLVYFQLVEAPALRKNSLNTRNWVDETKFGRGRFLDRYGEVIVEREKQEDGTYLRYSNHPHMYSHVIGYNSTIYGRTGLENTLNEKLLNIESNNAIAALRGSVLDEGIGNDVQLTIDNTLQYLAYTALEGHRGAAVAMNPNNGEILALVSYPSFNVNEMEDTWSELVDAPDDVLFPRATQGFYTPGSVMKPITALALLRSGIDLTYQDEGHTTVNGARYENYQGEAFGTIGLREALMYSSNVYFVDKTRDLDPTLLQEAADSVGMNQEIAFDIPLSTSVTPYTPEMDVNEKVSAAFGQGKDLVTPLQMTLAYTPFANGGTLYAPHLVRNFIRPDGKSQPVKPPEVLNTIETRYAKILHDDLVATGEAIGLSDAVGMATGGKTGTAETSDNSTNAWTIGFAPAENPQIVVGVVLEDEGTSGSESALPIVAMLLRESIGRSESFVEGD